MKLKWNKLENCFECVECGGLYGEEELSRAFEYSLTLEENFRPCHCMDCGVLWTEVEMEDYDGE